MSLVFKIKPKKNQNVKEIEELTVNEFLEHMGNNYDFLYKDKEFLKEKVLKNILVLGVEFITSRGFEFSCEEDYFEVRINTPATSNDWRIFIEFIEDLQNKTNGILINESNKTIKAENIDYEKDILSGIEIVKNHVNQYETITLLGSDKAITISKEMVNRILDSENKIKAFDEMMEKVFHSSSYFARQQFFKLNNELVGVYTLSYNYDIVLPLIPTINYENIGIEKEDGKISRWVLAIVLENEKVVEFDYTEGIKKIKNFNKIDNNQIEISSKTVEELKEIFNIK